MKLLAWLTLLAAPSAWAAGSTAASTPAPPEAPPSAAVLIDVPETSATVRMLLDLQTATGPAASAAYDERVRPSPTPAPARPTTRESRPDGDYTEAALGVATSSIEDAHASPHDGAPEFDESSPGRPAAQDAQRTATAAHAASSGGNTAFRALGAYLREHRSQVLAIGVGALVLTALATLKSARRRSGSTRRPAKAVRPASGRRRRPHTRRP